MPTESVHVDDIVAQLKSLGNPKDAEGMARYGVTGLEIYGVRIPQLRKLARQLKRNHALALALWQIPARETRILACMIADPRQVDEELLEAWVQDFNNWEVCDQCCMNVFEKTRWAWEKAMAWSYREETFVKRAGFVLMARLAVSDKDAPDERFEPFLRRVEEEAHDERPMVHKAVSWALRQIGKRNPSLRTQALRLAQRLAHSDNRNARRIGKEALRDLRPEVRSK